MRTNNSGCINAFVSSFSRIMLLIFWISRPVQMNLAFNTFILPCLGILFLPFTTLIYVWLMQGAGSSIQGLDWLWLVLAFIMDLGSLGGVGYSNRDRLPPGVPGSTAGQQRF